MRRAPTRWRSSPGRCCSASGSTSAWRAVRRYPWLVLTVALFGLFSVGFTITILSVSIPRIADELGSDASTVTWVVTGPLLAFAVVGPAAGKLGDLYGHRRVTGSRWPCVSVFAALTAAGVERRLRSSLFRIARRGHRRRHRARRRSPSSTGSSRRSDGCRPWATGRWWAPAGRSSAWWPVARSWRRSGGGGSSSPRCRSRSPACCWPLLVLPEHRAPRTGRRSTTPARIVLAVGATSLLARDQPGAAVGLVGPRRSSPAS